MALLDERLTMNEDRVRAVGERLEGALQAPADTKPGRAQQDVSGDQD